MFEFIDELDSCSPTLTRPRTKPWLIMITDDDEDMHHATKYALAGVLIHGRPISFIDAYTGMEAMNIINKRTDVDLMILDAVMESETAGITCANFVKHTLKRKTPTIVLRTGYAGWEVENSKVNLDAIDDFLHKTKVTNIALVNILEKWLPAEEMA